MQQENEENVKILTHAWEDSGLSQGAFAQRIGIHRSYLNSLLGGKIEIQPWILEKLKELEPPVKKSTGVEMLDSGNPYHVHVGVEKRNECLTYILNFVDSCTNEDQLAWTLIELKEHFPLDKWKPK
jgi:hypothetical protein